MSNSSSNLDDDSADLRAATRKFVDGPVTPMLAASEAAGTMSPELLDLIQKQGYSGLRIAEEWGGKGLRFSQFCAVLEEFARLGPTLHFWLTDSIGLTVQRLGTPAQKEKYLRPYAQWQLRGSLAFSEPEAGSDASAIRTRAEPRDGGWVINGRKHYSSRAESAHFVLVTAKTDAGKGARGGITTFLVDSGTPGFTVTRTDESMGSRLHKLAELSFEDCFVPADAVLGEVGQGFAAAMSTLDDGRLAVASTCVGVASRLLELMTEHVKTRRTFGAPLSDRQGIRWMIADSVVEIELGRALLKESIAKLERGEPIKANASICKLHCSEMVNRIADRAVQVFGGMGLIRGVLVEQLYRDVRFLRVGEGASEIQRMLFARSVRGRPGREGD